MTQITTALLTEFRRMVSRLPDPTLSSFAAEIDWEMPARDLAPRSLPCLEHISATCAHASARTQTLVDFVARHARELHWGQTYTEADLGRHFIDNYGWVELFGTRGHYVNDRLAGGLLLLGSGVEYPDHHHVAEEVYIALTGGAFWRRGNSDYSMRDAGQVIHHPSNVSHAMKTTRVPLLALYLWRGGPLAARSTFAAAEG